MDRYGMREEQLSIPPRHCKSTSKIYKKGLGMPRQQLLRSWSTIECCRPAVWTSNRSLRVASCLRDFPGRPVSMSFPKDRRIRLLHTESCAPGRRSFFCHRGCKPSPTSPVTPPSNRYRTKPGTHLFRQQAALPQNLQSPHPIIKG